MKKWVILFLIFGSVLTPTFSFGFTLAVTPTSETCNGNGSLAFNPANVNPNGTIVYIIYKLPNTTVPFTSVNTNSINGLSSGDYRVIAKETVGNTTTSQQTDVTITSTVVPLTYSVQSLNQACSSTSNISVTIISGVAANYEIFSGPKLFPLQASNTFIGLSVGVYKIRVFDTCGVGVVQTFTATLNPADLKIGSPIFSNTNPSSCNFTVATNTITPAAGTIIGYPLSIQYTVHPPNGDPDIIIINSLNTGNPNTQDLSETIPLYLNQNYSYDLSIKDICGKTYLKNFVPNQAIILKTTLIDLECNQNYFMLSTTNFTPPYTLNFTNAPAGFNPNSFNANYPGPFNTEDVDFGNATNPTPKGDYTVTILDACGRTTTRSLTILSVPPIPTPEATNNGCLTNSGKITVNLLSNYHIATAIITAAPAEYAFPLPNDVSSFIDTNGVLILDPVPLGDYVFLLTNTCNDVIAPVPVSLPVYINQGITFDTRQGCDLQTGAVKITSKNSNKLKSVTVISAPTNFPNTLPFDASINIITDGTFYLDALPAGNYKFSSIDECGFNNTIDVAIDGYKITKSTFSLNPNCGSFDIPLDFVSNGNINETFWIQKLLNIGTNIWGHPDTMIAYVDGTVPTAANSFQIDNTTTNLNLTFSGTFRIVRTFSTYNNGVAINNGTVATETKNCVEILAPNLTFNEALEITDANRIACTISGSLDVIIKANGTLPLHYSIITKDGVPFVLDNGNSNVFVNLPPAIYTFQVEDNCGGIKNKIFNVSSLVSLVNNIKPCDILKCVTTITGNEVFDLTSQNSIILGNQSPNEYTLSYYTSLTNAQAAINPIVNLVNFIATTNPQTIYSRLVFNQLPNCYETTSFDLIAGQIPKINVIPTTLNCTQSPVVLDASLNNLASTTYSWSNGLTTPIITVSQLGVTKLTVTTTNAYGICNNTNTSCTNTEDIAVIIPEIPVIEKIETHDWTPSENSIQVVTSNNVAFEYSIDNNNYQDSNSFTNLEAGLYTVSVRNREGCQTVKQEIWLLNYEKYFTPNDDGFNDTWLIKNSEQEPDFKVIIYDRYGKIIKSFKSDTAGWDGNYNGRPMLATDFWFVVYRQDGRIHKGHFSLLR
ncbi:T9SS type B sorting domain-containing protein [Flavobacterium psychrotolerans]|uniref:Ig-like domain-containing protein n=1 Tax=Flavobacterium psychrotolerans TaxID=2169410 RepID=A0A2U1JQH8_9FLAO|nr:T9SS type B sorting domain-containing protein [Flavobacterium psychrotolerans]PWA07209.1 hypothetical protein DB895_00340 [Flavobacterium psychrotolerans]